jgi:hypothetical protein
MYQPVAGNDYEFMIRATETLYSGIRERLGK